MITSALNVSAPASGAAPQDAVQGRGGKEKSEDFGNALSSVSQRQSKGQGEGQRGEAEASPAAAQDVEGQQATSSRISISGVTNASATLRMDLTMAAQLSRQPEGDGKAPIESSGESALSAEGEMEVDADPKGLHAKSDQHKIKTKGHDEATEDAHLPKKLQATDGKTPDVPNADTTNAEAGTVADGVNSALSLLTGSAEIAALVHGPGKTPSTGNSVRVNSEDGKRDANSVQKQSLVGDTASAVEPELAVEVPGTEGVSGEKTFRFAGSRGASMDMIVGTGADGKTTFETGRSGNGSAEQVTVLDSRRFLGFSQSPNGAALTTAMSQDQDWAAAMHPGSALSNAAAQSSTGNVVNTLKLQMTPVDLGSVTATLRLVGEQLSVHLTVETRAAHSQLTSDSSGILEALRSQGFAVDQVTVTITPTSQSDNSQQANDSGQRGAMQGQQGNGGAGQGQGQQSPRSDTPFMTGNDDYETAADPRLGAASGSDAGSGDIYL